ncbi:MAG: flagellar motor switch protein FliG [Alphaproteobacteria bacterium]|nr:flagellar motor switch protein FliG [Alphaproteobacteria bacterium]MBV9553797.1 flagellar motor switch protein FliG [Alphaproteobacteria bacterium]
MTEAALDRPARLSDLEKSAVVMLSIGEAAAAEVMKHMTQLEINLLSVAMARISGVSKTEVTEVFEEFIDLMLQETSIGIGAEAYVHGVLEQALGPEKAERLAGRLKQGDYFAGIEAVQLQDPRVLAEMIKSEHPQIVAMIFAYMEPEQADALIQHLPPELVEQVIPRLATLDSIPPAAIRELNESIEDLLAGETQQARVTVGGVGMAAKILNRIDTQRVESILAQIGTVDPDLAQAIQNSMFVFEDLMRLDDRNFQMLLRSIDQKLLASALKGADAKLLDKVTKNLSQRSAEMLREEISSRGPMRVSEIDAAKREIVAIAQRLESEGTIVLPTDAGDLVT